MLAVPSAPRQVYCKSSTHLTKCSINCNWKEPVSHGSSTIRQYRLIVNNDGQQMIYNRAFEAGQTDYSIINTSFPFYIPNRKFNASVIAINDVGLGNGSSDTFVAPGRKHYFSTC